MIIKKIFVVGAGYVGLANGLALAKNYKVVFVDNNQEKLNLINNQSSPIKEIELDEAILNFAHNISTANSVNSIQDDSLVILSLPTNYDEDKDYFDTSILESIVQEICDLEKKVTIVIKSTVPIGYTSKLIAKYPKLNIYFSPEFLREGISFKDIKNPERIIISPDNNDSKSIAEIFCSATENFNIDNVLLMSTNEAESVKLFANTYLAMRVAFINEIDTFCEEKNLNAVNVINGICKDSRIGEGYNNPSFGYGGYCLPKDTKQVKSSFKGIPESLISAVIKSNENRAAFIASKIIKTKKRVIGFYRLNMKAGSDNMRNSSSIKIIELLLNYDVQIIIYELNNIQLNIFQNSKISFTDDFKLFSKKSELIIANRLTPEIKKLGNKVYSRDVFHEN